MALYQVTFTVRGKCPFPLDMLRYDGCWPSGGEDAEAIGWSIERRRDADNKPLEYRIKLARLTKQRYWRPTEGRWSSFSWSVDTDSVKFNPL